MILLAMAAAVSCLLCISKSKSSVKSSWYAAGNFQARSVLDSILLICWLFPAFGASDQVSAAITTGTTPLKHHFLTNCLNQRPILRIGAYFSLSGAGAQTAIPEAHDGLMFIINKINNASIGPYTIQVSVCDDQFILAKAMDCWRKLAMEDQVQIVIGGHTSFTINAGNYFEPLGILNIQYAI